MTLVFIFSFLENVSVIQKSMRIKGAFKRKNLSEASFVGTAIGNLFVLTVFKARQLEKNMLLKGSDD